MPDHLHALVELGESGDLSLTMQHVKGRTSRQAGIRLQRHGRLWSKGFHDHALRREEAVADVIRYIIANPVRAGLVKQIADYPYWDVHMGKGEIRDLLAGLDFKE
jgi:REP element-mobilizing transposase RayT